MIPLAYVGLILCGIIVGGSAGGIIGKLSIGRADQGLGVVLVSAFLFQWLGYKAVVLLKDQTGSGVPMAIYCAVVLIFALLGFAGARRGPN